MTGMPNMTHTRYAWLITVLEHQTHHRGQTTINIRLVGVGHQTRDCSDQFFLAVSL
jgi:uncharacterized damage-inducible protein DinB